MKVNRDDLQNDTNVFPDGNYPGTVVRVIEKQDKNGNPMFAVSVRVEHEGITENVLDHVSPAWMRFKFRHLLQSAGIPTEGEGSLEVEAEDLIGTTVLVALKTERYDGQDRNKIDDYIIESTEATDTEEVPF